MSEAPLAAMRAAAVAVRTPEALDRLLDDFEAVDGEQLALAEAAAEVAQPVSAARQALEQVAAK